LREARAPGPLLQTKFETITGTWFHFGCRTPPKKERNKTNKIDVPPKRKTEIYKESICFRVPLFFLFLFFFLNKNVFLVNAVNVNVRLFILQRRPSRSILSDRWITADYQSRRLLSNTN
jgi:hypothetical protein